VFHELVGSRLGVPLEGWDRGGSSAGFYAHGVAGHEPEYVKASPSSREKL